MTKVKFFNDFQGVETNNVFYPAGIYNVPEQVPQNVADRVVKDGRAEFVKAEGKVSPPVEELQTPPVVEPVETPAEDTSIMTSRKFKRGK